MKLHEKIREIRTGLGLTLSDVHDILVDNIGEKDAISYRTLQRIESGHIAKFANVLKICSALGITLNELIKDTDFEQKSIIRKSERYSRYYYNDKAYADIVSTSAMSFIASEVTLEPTGKTLIERSPDDGKNYEKFIHVKTGILTVILGDETHLLEKGDSISFNSSIPHRLENNAAKKCICLTMLNPKHF